MRIVCPHCGERDRREFTWQGDALALSRPAPDAGEGPWDDYVHLRENPAGRLRELWYHDPCGTWTVVERDTVTHAVFGAVLATEVAR
jgi:sarcosine oxidase subunit delta